MFSLLPEEKTFIATTHASNANYRSNLLLKLKRNHQINNYLKNEQASLNAILDLAEPLLNPDSRVLLLGCSNLSLIPIIKRRYKNIFAVDPSPTLVSNAKSYNYNCILRPFEELYLLQEKFDFIIAFNVLQLSLYPQQILFSFYHILNTNGLVGHVTPHTFPNVLSHHICNYDSKRWASLYKQAHFEVLFSPIKVFNQKELHILALKA